MKPSCTFEDSILPDACAKKAKVQVKENAVTSFPFTIEDILEKTKSFAWTFVDYGSIPVCGFAYIYQAVASASADVTVVPEDFPRLDNKYACGKNSLVSKLLNEDYSDIDEGYMEPYPPDRDHIYTLIVYALGCELPLANGPCVNELLHAIKGHVLAEEKPDLVGKY